MQCNYFNLNNNNKYKHLYMKITKNNNKYKHLYMKNNKMQYNYLINFEFKYNLK